MNSGDTIKPACVREVEAGWETALEDAWARVGGPVVMDRALRAEWVEAQRSDRARWILGAERVAMKRAEAAQRRASKPKPGPLEKKPCARCGRTVAHRAAGPVRHNAPEGGKCEE